MNLTDIHERAVLKGEKFSIDEISNALRGFAVIRKIDLLTISKLLFEARKVMPKKEWKRWADEVTGLSRCEIYHRAQVGQLLDLAFEDKVLYKKLLNFSGDKLLALHRLAVAGGLPLVESFLAVNRIDNIAIDQVRMLVECELCCLKHGSKPDCEHCNCISRSGHPMNTNQLALPGFEETLDAVWQMSDGDICANVQNDTQAVKCVSGGVKMVAAYIEHQKNKFRSNPTGGTDMVNLLQLKAALLDGIKDIEALIAGTIDNQEEEDYENPQIYAAGIAGDTAIEQCGTTAQTDEQSTGSVDTASGEKLCGITQNHTGDTTVDGPVDYSGKMCGRHTNDGNDHHGCNCQSGTHQCHCGDECLCGSSGGCSCGSKRTAEVPPVLPGAQAPCAQDTGSDDRQCGGFNSN